MKSFYLQLITIIIIFSKSNNEQCQKVKCDSIKEENICILPENDISTFQLCSENKICNIISEDPIDKTKCEDKKEEIILKYSGLSCNNDNECYSKKCKDKKCEGIKENEECNSTSQCDYGKVCRKSNNKNICTTPLKENDDCTNEKECDNEFGCLNGKCTKYFSIKNGEVIGLDYNDYLSFCESGFADENGECKNLTLNENQLECNEENSCEYKDNEGNILKIPDNCLCGYNKFGTQYCLLGSGNSNYTRYINLLKKYYINNTNCHLDERSYKGCLKDIEESKNIKDISILINSKYWAKENNRLYNAPSCVIKIEIPEFNLNIDPGSFTEKKCAKYTCESSSPDSNCAKSEFKNEEEINVTLYDICPEGNYCYLDGKKPNIYFYEGKDKTAKCQSSIPNINNRYPGEDCDTNTNCVYPINTIFPEKFHKCENNKCIGLKKGEDCYFNEECIVGYFCDSNTKKCKSLGEKEDPCINSFECENDLLCYENKCQNILFSFEEGKQTPKNEKNREKYCKYGEIDDSGVCIKIVDQIKAKDNEYRECERDMKCLYNALPITSGTISKECGCGYNQKGIGYCPKFHDYFEKDWEDYFSYLKKTYDNKCHTLNRYNCYLNSKYDEKLKTLKNKLIDGHLFFNAEKCAQKVLNGNCLKVNYVLFLLIIAFII